jgi:hypothetical protein
MLQEMDSTVRISSPDIRPGHASYTDRIVRPGWRCDKIQRLAAVGHDADDIAHNVLQSSLGERTKIESRLGKFF